MPKNLLENIFEYVSLYDEIEIENNTYKVPEAPHVCLESGNYFSRDKMPIIWDISKSGEKYKSLNRTSCLELFEKKFGHLLYDDAEYCFRFGNPGSEAQFKVGLFYRVGSNYLLYQRKLTYVNDYSSTIDISKRDLAIYFIDKEKKKCSLELEYNAEDYQDIVNSKKFNVCPQQMLPINIGYTVTDSPLIDHYRVYFKVMAKQLKELKENGAPEEQIKKIARSLNLTDVKDVDLVDCYQRRLDEIRGTLVAAILDPSQSNKYYFHQACIAYNLNGGTKGFFSEAKRQSNGFTLFSKSTSQLEEELLEREIPVQLLQYQAYFDDPKNQSVPRLIERGEIIEKFRDCIGVFSGNKDAFVMFQMVYSYAYEANDKLLPTKEVLLNFFSMISDKYRDKWPTILDLLQKSREDYYNKKDKTLFLELLQSLSRGEPTKLIKKELEKSERCLVM